MSGHASLCYHQQVSSIYIENVKYSVTVKLIIVSVTNRSTHDPATYLAETFKMTQKLNREFNTFKILEK